MTDRGVRGPVRAPAGGHRRLRLGRALPLPAAAQPVLLGLPGACRLGRLVRGHVGREHRGRLHRGLPGRTDHVGALRGRVPALAAPTAGSGPRPGLPSRRSSAAASPRRSRSRSPAMPRSCPSTPSSSARRGPRTGRPDLQARPGARARAARRERPARTRARSKCPNRRYILRYLRDTSRCAMWLRTGLFAAFAREFEVPVRLSENRGVPGSSPGLAFTRGANDRDFLLSGA